MAINGQLVDGESDNPQYCKSPKSTTGTAMVGISVARRFPMNRRHDNENKEKQPRKGF
jgi:hypothetical protein